MNAVVVPVRVRALVVNERMRRASEFTRWKPTFEDLLDRTGTAEPENGQSVQQVRQPFQGIHVQWELPGALAAGPFEHGSEQGNWILVPNRWMIVRYADVGADKPNVRGWVVQSDYLQSSNLGVAGTSPFLTPQTSDITEPRLDWIGRSHDLSSGPWTEPGTAQAPFLTALGTGLPAFPAYEPYHQNVFSFHDTAESLEAIAPHREAMPVSYMVVGWYSDPSIDIVNNGDAYPWLFGDGRSDHSLEETLQALGWNHAATRADQSLYHGAAFHTTWDLWGDAPPSKQPSPLDAQVRVGNSLAEILQEEQPSLAALYLGELEKTEAAGNAAATARRNHREGFVPANAAPVWQVSARRDIDDAPGADFLTPTWVRDLNDTQQELATAIAEAEAVRDRWVALNVLATTPNSHRPPDITDAMVAEYGASARSAYHELTTLQTRIASLVKSVPHGSTAEELADRAQEYAVAHGLDTAHFELSIGSGNTFWTAADPAFYVSGSGFKSEDAPLAANEQLRCREITNLTLSATPAGASAIRPPASPPSPTAPQAIAASMPELLRDFWIWHTVGSQSAIDETIATHAYTGEAGTYVAQWQQPWVPMYIAWRLQYFKTAPTEDPAAPNWTLKVGDDSIEYIWDGSGTIAGDGEGGLDGHQFSGRAFLNPTVRQVTASQLRRYRETYSVETDRGLDRVSELLDAADILSQRFEGFNQWLQQRTGQPYLSDISGVPLADGGMNIDPRRHSRQSRFSGMRAGQYFLTDLRVVDRFGQTMVLIDQADHGPRQFDPRPTSQQQPTANLYPSPKDTQRFVQLPPRILTDARVNITPASPDVPVAGWLVNNYLQRTVQVFLPDGSALGYLQRTANDQVGYQPSPNPGDRIDSADFGTRHPVLSGFLTGLNGPSERLEALMQLLDHTSTSLEHVNESLDSSFGRLLGEPFALVPVELALELRNPPATDPSWSTSGKPPTADVLSRSWPIVLGRIGDELDDGLAGYYAHHGSSFDFTAIRPARIDNLPTSTYISPVDVNADLRLIADVLPDREVASAALLLHATSPMRAHSGVLPAAEFSLNPVFADHTINALSGDFRTGPVISTIGSESGDRTDDTLGLDLADDLVGIEQRTLQLMPTNLRCSESDPATFTDTRLDTVWLSPPLSEPIMVHLVPDKYRPMRLFRLNLTGVSGATTIQIRRYLLDATGGQWKSDTFDITADTPQPIEMLSDSNNLDLADIEIIFSSSDPTSVVGVAGVNLYSPAPAEHSSILLNAPDESAGTWSWSAPFPDAGTDRALWTRHQIRSATMQPDSQLAAAAAHDGYLRLQPRDYAPTPLALQTVTVDVANGTVRYRYKGIGHPRASLEVRDGSTWIPATDGDTVVQIAADGTFDWTSTIGRGSSDLPSRARQVLPTQDAAAARSSAIAFAETRASRPMTLEMVTYDPTGQWGYQYSGSGTPGATLELLDTTGDWSVPEREIIIDAAGRFFVVSTQIGSRAFCAARQKIGSFTDKHVATAVPQRIAQQDFVTAMKGNG